MTTVFSPIYHYQILYIHIHENKWRMFTCWCIMQTAALNIPSSMIILHFNVREDIVWRGSMWEMRINMISASCLNHPKCFDNPTLEHLKHLFLFTCHLGYLSSNRHIKTCIQEPEYTLLIQETLTPFCSKWSEMSSKMNFKEGQHPN